MTANTLFQPDTAATLLASHWNQGQHLQALPPESRPISRAQGYAVQALWPAHVGPAGGWKIAATSVAGQRHIGVSGPLVGPVFAHRVVTQASDVSLAHNRMRVAECEIVFRFRHALTARNEGWSLHDVLAAVESVHPGIEVPDSRFMAFETAGEAQLLADCACANDMVLGNGLAVDERVHTLSGLQVRASVSDGRQFEGVGSNVLGDPLEALRWFANEITQTGQTVLAGQFVTTGACVLPIPVLPGQTVQADFGWLGQMQVRFAPGG